MASAVMLVSVVVFGWVAPGDQLPSEAEIAELCGVGPVHRP
ncbi:hypothetical protein ABZ553_04750 [Streptomyces sparsogenes]